MQLGVVMDPIQGINYHKDSTLAMLWEAERRGASIFYIEQQDLFLREGEAFAEGCTLQVFEDPAHWFSLSDRRTRALRELDVILMRKDPPFNEKFIYTTYILDHAAREGVLVVNHPQALRDANEKFFTGYFPQCAPPTLVTQSRQRLLAFWREHHDIVCKPLNSMGGVLVFRLKDNDVNANVILDALTQNGNFPIMAQRFIPEISEGDKRIILINGEPIPYALARVPQENDWRGNLAVGAKGVVRPLTPRDQWICQQVGPVLRERGLYFVGIDVIGDYLTEVNVTSPTGIRELDDALNINISAQLFDFITATLKDSQV